MGKNDILDKAKTIINGERQGTYGNAEDNFASIAAFWSTYLNTAINSTDVANMMILMKVARNASGVYKDDNYIDICGYAALGGEIAARPSKNEVTYASIMNAIKQVGEEIDEYIASVKEDDTNEE